MSADLDLVWRVLDGELEQIPPRERKRCRWVLRWDMFTWIRGLVVDDALAGPGALYVNMEQLAAQIECLAGLPVDIRDGVEGIHLVTA